MYLPLFFTLPAIIVQHRSASKKVLTFASNLRKYP